MPEENPSVSVRRLKEEDKPLIMDLWRTHRTIMGVAKSEKAQLEFETIIEKYLIGAPDRTQMGAFKNGFLIATAGVLLWSVLPNCTLLNLIIDRRYTRMLYRADLNGLEACRSACYEFGIQNGHFQFYCLTSLKKFRTAQRIRNKRSSQGNAANRDTFLTQDGRSFTRVLDSVIPARSRPAYSFYWEMMGQRIWPIDLAIFIDVLNPGLRPSAELSPHEQTL